MRIIDKMPARPFYSLEFFPPQEEEQLFDFFQMVERLQDLKPIFASVTYGAGGGTQKNTLEVAARLQALGLSAMPHLTCVGASSESIMDFLLQMRKLNLHNVMALRGDPPAGQDKPCPNHQFPHAAALVQFIRSAFPEIGIAVAGYPEGHPQSLTLREDRHHTQLKMDAGANFMITQMFFDVRQYLEMVERLRALGMRKPILPGVMPILSLASLRRILSLCDARIPGNFYLQLEAAHQRGGSQAVREAGAAFAAEQIRRLRDSGAPGIHLYTLNQAEVCLEIADRVGKL